ncbi:MAG: hypothetical protein OXF49_01495 [Candidatus Saccharibacteria bacterium]|nr:hypothetical protein [Candidatus Saccharibacteria bacterium]
MNTVLKAGKGIKLRNTTLSDGKQALYVDCELEDRVRILESTCAEILDKLNLIIEHLGIDEPTD